MLYIVMCRDLKTGQDKEVPMMYASMRKLSEARAWQLANKLEKVMSDHGIRQPFWATPILDI